MRATSAGAGTVPGPLNTAWHTARRRWRGAGAGATSAWTRLLVRFTTNPTPALRLASRRLFSAAARPLPSTFINAAAAQVQQLRIHGKGSQDASPPPNLAGERERSRAQICRTDATKKQGAGRMTDKEHWSRGDRQYARSIYGRAHNPTSKNHGPWSWGRSNTSGFRLLFSGLGFEEEKEASRS